MDTGRKSQEQVGKDLIKGTMIAGALGIASGGIIGILRQQPVGGYAFSGGLNASLFGMTFIAFRESFLRFQQSKNPHYGLKNSQTMDIDQLWSSTFAGAFTGGILAALQGGAKVVPSGTFMCGVIAMGGQWIYSKTNRYRQDRILATIPTGHSSSSVAAAAATETSANARPKDHDAMGSSLLKVLPVHRTDVDEYEAKLLQKMELIEKEQRMLEEEVLRRKRIATEQAVQEKVV
ncbi:hypothetical protein EDD11_009101 [Mortierella claussenii]|nr:hypothetical protein EDD11_009101 [Mortierella claussenii]